MFGTFSKLKTKQQFLGLIITCIGSYKKGVGALKTLIFLTFSYQEHTEKPGNETNFVKVLKKALADALSKQ